LDHLPTANLTIDAATVCNWQFGITHNVSCSAMPTEKVSFIGDFLAAHRCIVCALNCITKGEAV